MSVKLNLAQRSHKLMSRWLGRSMESAKVPRFGNRILKTIYNWTDISYLVRQKRAPISVSGENFRFSMIFSVKSQSFPLTFPDTLITLNKDIITSLGKYGVWESLGLFLAVQSLKMTVQNRLMHKKVKFCDCHAQLDV